MWEVQSRYFQLLYCVAFCEWQISRLSDHTAVAGSSRRTLDSSGEGWNTVTMLTGHLQTTPTGPSNGQRALRACCPHNSQGLLRVFSVLIDNETNPARRVIVLILFSLSPSTFINDSLPVWCTNEKEGKWKKLG